MLKCDNCSFEADEEKNQDEFDEIWCEDCTDYEQQKLRWRAVICTKCYNKRSNLEILKIHFNDCHTSVDLI